MKINKIFKRITILGSLFIPFLLLVSIEGVAQNYSIKDRWNVKLDYSSYPSLGSGYRIGKDYTPAFLMDLNYGINEFIETGYYMGYCKIQTEEPFIPGEQTTIKKANTLFYGINGNVHLFPFLVKSKNFRFDLYTSGKLGGFYRLSEDGMYPERGFVWDYGIYAGAAFYFSKHIGLFGEYGIGNYTNNRFGLSLKF